MYLPATEMQWYKGQLHCQYCIMDLRDEDKRNEKMIMEKDKYIKAETIHETCQRCGRILSIAYFYNGKKLCETCMEEERKDWEKKGGERPPMTPYRISSEQGILSSMLHHIIKKILIALGFKREKTDGIEIVSAKKRVKKRRVKPMSESLRKTVKGDGPFSKKVKSEGPIEK